MNVGIKFPSRSILNSLRSFLHLNFTSSTDRSVSLTEKISRFKHLLLRFFRFVSHLLSFSLPTRSRVAVFFSFLSRNWRTETNQRIHTHWKTGENTQTSRKLSRNQNSNRSPECRVVLCLNQAQLDTLRRGEINLLRDLLKLSSFRFR